MKEKMSAREWWKGSVKAEQQGPYKLNKEMMGLYSEENRPGLTRQPLFQFGSPYLLGVIQLVSGGVGIEPLVEIDMWLLRQLNAEEATELAI
jgi:hypothetical protein